MLSISSLISVTFGSFKNSFQKYSFSCFFKEAFDVVFSLILEGRLLEGRKVEKSKAEKQLIALKQSFFSNCISPAVKRFFAWPIFCLTIWLFINFHSNIIIYEFCDFPIAIKNSCKNVWLPWKHPIITLKFRPCAADENLLCVFSTNHGLRRFYSLLNRAWDPLIFSLLD